jgi:hypothetical protein
VICVSKEDLRGFLFLSVTWMPYGPDPGSVPEPDSCILFFIYIPRVIAQVNELNRANGQKQWLLLAQGVLLNVTIEKRAVSLSALQC